MLTRQLLKSAKALGLIALTSIVVAGASTPASAQVVEVSRADSRNLIGFNVGGFLLKGVDSRDPDDVLLANLNDLDFRIEDFNNWTFGGEWLYGFGKYFETGVGVGFYQKTVPTVYRDFENDNGSLIAQDLKLKIVPITGTVRFLPVGRGAAVEPYIGGGIGIFNWRYSEAGEFVDFSDDTIFRDVYTADGTAFGPVIVAGLRIPIGDAFTAGFEYRWQDAVGDTKPEESRLIADKIDLGGNNFLFTMHFRF